MSKLKARTNKGQKTKYTTFESREDGLRNLIETLYDSYGTFEELIESLPKELALTDEDIDWCRLVYEMTATHKGLGID